AAGTVVRHYGKPRFGKHFASWQPGRNSSHENRLLVLRTDVPRLLVAFLASPLVPAIRGDDDSFREKRAPEWRLLEDGVEPRVAGRPALVPGRFVAPEQPVCLLGAIAEAVQGDRACARWHVVLQPVRLIERRARIPTQML